LSVGSITISKQKRPAKPSLQGNFFLYLVKTPKMMEKKWNFCGLFWKNDGREFWILGKCYVISGMRLTLSI
jgi:hypothetical protein